MYAFPQTYYSRGNHGSAPMEPSPGTPGLTIKQFYLAHILQGLASNPTTMLNIEEHLDYAERLADRAARMLP